MTRYLLVLPGRADADWRSALEQLEGVVRPEQVLPPRLAAFTVDDDQREVVLGRLREFGTVVSGMPPAGLLAGLTDAERLFARAWSEPAEKPARAGDGLNWDAPGHLAPDLPVDDTL